MNHDAALCALEDVFRRCFHDESLCITAQTTACDVDGWDSLAHVRLLMMIEQRFDVALPPSRTTHLKNVGELADLVLQCAQVRT